MRQSHSKARRCEPERESCGTHHAPRLRARVDPLALPKLNLGTTDIAPSGVHARLALQFMDAGYLNDDDCLISTSSADLVVLALKRCIEKNKGETPLLTDFAINLFVDTPPDFYNMDEDWDQEKVAAYFVNHWFYTIDTDGMNVRLLEPRFNIIEAKAPGLFRAALNILDRSVSPITRSGTPNAIREMMEEHQWGGFDNNEYYFEECVGCPEEESEDDGVSPLLFREGLPEWLVKPMSSEMYEFPDPSNEDQTLEAALVSGYAQHADPDVAAIAQCLLDLESAAKTFTDADMSFHMLIYQSPIYAMSILRWNKGDNLQRAVDDYIHDANRNADCFTPEITQTFVGRDDESFKKWIRGFVATMTILNRANTLIEIISVPDDN